jgi:hypothetical protein
MRREEGENAIKVHSLTVVDIVLENETKHYKISKFMLLP